MSVCVLCLYVCYVRMLGVDVMYVCMRVMYVSTLCLYVCYDICDMYVVRVMYAILRMYVVLCMLCMLCSYVCCVCL